MPQFKRFVAYLYYYENDTKEYLAGFLAYTYHTYRFLLYTSP